jgi:hypothetical protein
VVEKLSACDGWTKPSKASAPTDKNFFLNFMVESSVSIGVAVIELATKRGYLTTKPHLL